MEYLVHPVKRKYRKHLWTGEDTVCRMYSTGGIRSEYIVVSEKIAADRNLCHMCGEVWKSTKGEDMGHFSELDAQLRQLAEPEEIRDHQNKAMGVVTAAAHAAFALDDALAAMQILGDYGLPDAEAFARGKAWDAIERAQRLLNDALREILK